MELDTKVAINNIIDLIKKDGVFYALLFTLFEDSHIHISELDSFDPNLRISADEAHWLIGFMIKHNPSFVDSFPKTIGDLLTLSKDIHKALKELELSYVRKTSSTDEYFNSQQHISAALSIATHYDGDSAYDYEYANFSIQRYKGVENWLRENRNIDIGDCTKIAMRIESLLLAKSNNVRLFSEEEFEMFLGQDPKEEELDRLRICQFVELFDDDIYSNDKVLYQNSIKSFCKNLLDLFCFSKEELGNGLDSNSFLDQFSFSLSKEFVENNHFDTPGRFNVLDSQPIIRVQDNKYFVPYVLNVFKAIYETPYYWLMEDTKYQKEASRLIGDAHERMVYNLLKRVFGDNQCWQGVIIQKGKHQLTDIDILCILGSKAICVQVKSKKLSEKSKTGDYDSIVSDFEKSVIASYKQAEKCKVYIKDPNVKFINKDKREIEIPNQNITDIYLMCIIGGEYEGLAHHVSYLFKSSHPTSLPLICSMFDLHLLTEYLKNPYDFTYYVKQRIETWEFFKFTNEISALGYHLKNNLHSLEGYNVALIDDDYARMIDKDYMPYLHCIKETLDINLAWRSDFMNQFCSLLEDPKFLDVLFLINDFSTDTRETFEEKVTERIKRSSANHSMASISMHFDDALVGLTVCAASDEFSIDDIKLYTEHKAMEYLRNINFRYPKWYIIAISSSKAHVYFVDKLEKQ